MAFTEVHCRQEPVRAPEHGAVEAGPHLLHLPVHLLRARVHHHVPHAPHLPLHGHAAGENVLSYW